jgi:uncharacterized membrane protein
MHKLLVALLILLTIAFGYGVVKGATNNPPTTVIDPVDNADNWHMGIFYYSKIHKRIFPPKPNRIMGWTVNFANPLSVGAVILILGAIIYFGFSRKFRN